MCYIITLYDKHNSVETRWATLCCWASEVNQLETRQVSTYFCPVCAPLCLNWQDNRTWALSRWVSDMIGWYQHTDDWSVLQLSSSLHLPPNTLWDVTSCRVRPPALMLRFCSLSTLSTRRWPRRPSWSSPSSGRTTSRSVSSRAGGRRFWSSSTTAATRSTRGWNRRREAPPATTPRSSEFKLSGNWKHLPASWAARCGNHHGSWGS